DGRSPLGKAARYTYEALDFAGDAALTQGDGDKLVVDAGVVVFTLDEPWLISTGKQIAVLGAYEVGKQSLIFARDQRRNYWSDLKWQERSFHRHFTRVFADSALETGAAEITYTPEQEELLARTARQVANNWHGGVWFDDEGLLVPHANSTHRASDEIEVGRLD